MGDIIASFCILKTHFIKTKNNYESVSWVNRSSFLKTQALYNLLSRKFLLQAKQICGSNKQNIWINCFIIKQCTCSLPEFVKLIWVKVQGIENRKNTSESAYMNKCFLWAYI